MSTTIAPVARLFALVQTDADEMLSFHTVKVPAVGRPRCSGKLPTDVARWVLERLKAGCGETTALDGSQWRLTAAGPEFISCPVPSGWDRR